MRSKLVAALHKSKKPWAGGPDERKRHTEELPRLSRQALADAEEPQGHASGLF